MEDENLKLSRFTVTTSLEDGRIAVLNTHTNALITIPKTSFRSIVNGNESELVNNHLLELGILVEDREEELEEFMRYFYSVQHSGHVGLWLYLTSDCNLGCPYCYQGEDKPALKISKPIINRLITAIHDLQSKYEDKSLSVTFYGGEPLLNKEMLDYAMDQFNSEFSNMPRSYFMISNGTKIEGVEEVIRWAEKGLEGIQITLDGTKEEHDNRRFRLDSDEGTFDNILSNINLIKDTLPINIRINYDKGNFSLIPQVIDLLEKTGLNIPNITLTFEAIFDSDRSDYTKNQLIITESEEVEYLNYLLEYATKKDFNVAIGFEGPCTIRNFSGLVVYPNGNVYSCPGMAGLPDYSWGNVLSKLDFKKQKELLYEGIYPECNTCPLIPVCAGGCEWDELVNTGVQGRHCEYTKLLKVVKLSMKHRVNNKNNIASFIRV